MAVQICLTINAMPFFCASAMNESISERIKREATSRSYSLDVILLKK